MSEERAAQLLLARDCLADIRRDAGLPDLPGTYWRLRDLWDMRLSLQTFAAASDRSWRRVEARA